MKDVEKISNGDVTWGPGTLYEVLGKKAAMDSDARRKYYSLTDLGKEYRRLESLVNNTSGVISELEDREGGN
ncbi:hypothetical protein KFZ58_00185 [Virgibacillus sp. NKC19-16]|uniref:PadR family transcriptional regulator n=1 Tax=Virgibacillus salidurans TaxID=2831673 RepID=UPI001F43CF82|nr:PadR family transcriptional regulator [Virgibacillus sp. NKC19-16]UJL46442.1 hypothetical protein KFZ58_00185 [Virgibacillus sp. NKC19-16]